MTSFTRRIQRRGSPVRRLLLALGLGLLFAPVTWSPPASADDAPPPPPLLSPLEALFLPLKQAMAPLPPFLRDTDFKLHFRSYYLNNMAPNRTVHEAQTFSGSTAHKPRRPLD